MQDGSTFEIRNGLAAPVVFEFNNDGVTTTGNQIISFSGSSTADDIARSIASVVSGVASLGLRAETVTGSGVVRLNETPAHRVTLDPDPLNLALTGLTTAGVHGGAVPVQFVPDVTFDAGELAGVIINAVNFSQSNAFARLRGSETIFLDNVPTTGNAVNGLLTFTVNGIRDIGGNLLQPNRPNNETQFTILLGQPDIDLGDAPDPLGIVNGQYPTLIQNNGARHVIIPGAPFLGSSIDADLDGAFNLAADGDDSDNSVDVANSSLSFVGLSPYNIELPSLIRIQVPAGGAAAITEAGTFLLSDGTLSLRFELDKAGNGFNSGGDVLVSLNALDNQATVATKIRNSILANFPGLTPTLLGGGVIDLVGVTADHSINVTGTGLTNTLSVSDLQTFQISDGQHPPVTFEFNNVGGVAVGNVAIPFNTSSSHHAIADAIVAAITARLSPTSTNPLSGLAPVNLGDGRIHLGGVPQLSVTDSSGVLSVNVSSSPTQPPRHQIQISGMVSDGDTVTISDGVHASVTFEFDTTNSGVVGGRVSVNVITATDVDDIADALVSAVKSQITALNLSGLDPRNLGNGLVHIGQRFGHSMNLASAVPSPLRFTGQLPAAVQSSAPDCPCVYHQNC